MFSIRKILVVGTILFEVGAHSTPVTKTLLKHPSQSEIFIGTANLHYQPHETVLSVTGCIPGHDISCAGVFQELDATNDVPINEDYFFPVVLCPPNGYFKMTSTVQCSTGNSVKIMFVGCFDTKNRTLLKNESSQAKKKLCD